MMKRLFKRLQRITTQNNLKRNRHNRARKTGDGPNLKALRLAPGGAFEVHVEFKYTLRETDRKWVDIVSWKETDTEAAFVFRINQRYRFFQLYFGDGEQIQGELKFDTNEFVDVVTTLTYRRSQDITYASLVAGERKDVRFAVHKGTLAANIPEEKYREGTSKNGVDLRRVEMSTFPAHRVSLDGAEQFLAEAYSFKSADYYRSLNALGMEYFASKEYEKALNIFIQISSASSLNIYDVAFTRARSCINSLYQGSERTDVWGRFSSPEDALFGQARKSLSDGNTDAAVSTLSAAVREVFGGPGYQFSGKRLNAFINAFKSLVSTENTDAVTLPSVKPISVAIVSGMGWSGSGAVYDYLKEFEEVVAIKGETPYIEGSESLRKIFAALDDTEQLKDRIFDFFFYALIGHCYYRDSGDFKLFQDARRRLRSDRRDEYLDAVQGWCLLARAVCNAEGEERSRLFIKLSDYTVQQFSIGCEIPEGKVALLDNVVHIGAAAECIKFLSNVTLFCTFRDPRSNYVALLREAGHFKSSVGAYIRGRRDSFSNAFQSVHSARLTASKDSRKAVEIVRFEEFVLSEEYRKGLAAKLGLDLSKQAKHEYFKPWASMRNVVLHQEHPNQDDIKRIEKELGEYCYEPCIRPLQEGIPKKEKVSVT